MAVLSTDLQWLAFNGQFTPHWPSYCEPPPAAGEMAIVLKCTQQTNGQHEPDWPTYTSGSGQWGPLVGFDGSIVEKLIKVFVYDTEIIVWWYHNKKNINILITNQVNSN